MSRDSGLDPARDRGPGDPAGGAPATAQEGGRLSRPDPYDLARFLRAQEGVYETALREIRQGRKRSHWMWFVFPQVAGLGMSATSRRYAVRGLAEASAYLAHPVLGARLVECAAVALAVEGRSAHEIFGAPDDMKLRSCATLFARVSSPDSVFHRLLERFFDGAPDRRTLELLEIGRPGEVQ